MSWPEPGSWRPPRRREESITPRAEVDECRSILGQSCAAPWDWLALLEPEDWVPRLDEATDQNGGVLGSLPRMQAEQSGSSARTPPS